MDCGNCYFIQSPAALPSHDAVAAIIAKFRALVDEHSDLTATDAVPTKVLPFEFASKMHVCFAVFGNVGISHFVPPIPKDPT